MLKKFDSGELWALLVSIDLLKKLNLGELQILTDRFAMDSVLILLTNQVWRAPSFDGQISNGFCIDFIKK